MRTACSHPLYAQVASLTPHSGVPEFLSWARRSQHEIDSFRKHLQQCWQIRTRDALGVGVALVVPVLAGLALQQLDVSYSQWGVFLVVALAMGVVLGVGVRHLVARRIEKLLDFVAKVPHKDPLYRKASAAALACANARSYRDAVYQSQRDIVRLDALRMVAIEKRMRKSDRDDPSKI